MAQDRSTSTETSPQTEQPGKPDPALKRLDKLVGTWELIGRTLESKDDDIRGRVTIEWLEGGHFLLQRGEIDLQGLKFQSLEILGYDPSTNTSPSTVYSNMNGVPMPYCWDVQGNVVTHWTEGSKYTGTFNEDGTVLSGGWRPNKGIEESAENTYDAIMRRVK